MTRLCKLCGKEIAPKEVYINSPSGCVCTRCESEREEDMKRIYSAMNFLIEKQLWAWIDGRGGTYVGREELIDLLVEFKYD